MRVAILDDVDLLDGKHVKAATVNVVPAVKICPVVATLPSEADLTNLVARTLALRTATSGSSSSYEHHGTIVRYTQLEPSIDVFLKATNLRLTVNDLNKSASSVRKDLNRALGTCGTVNAIYWLSPAPNSPPAT